MKWSRLWEVAGVTCSLGCVAWAVVHCAQFWGTPGIPDWYDPMDDGPLLLWALKSDSIQSAWIAVSGALAILFLTLVRPRTRRHRLLLAATIAALFVTGACPRF